MKKQKKLQPPHLGNMLKNFYVERKVNKAGLARAIAKDKSTVQTYDTRASLPCRVLWDISVALAHNFFADIAAQLPQTYTTNIPEDTTQAQRIEQLEEENKILSGQLELLKGVMGK
jgi:hypothetical protein